jgi:hypothetical protein
MATADQPNAPEVVTVAVVVLLSCIASLVRGIQVYRDRKSWVNFLILRNASGNLIAQTINVFGMSLGLFDGVLAMRIFYVMGYIGMCFHFLLSVYRFQIFGTLLPNFIRNYLKVKVFAPVIVIFCLLCWIPMTIHVTSDLEFAQSNWFFVWTISMFFAWMLIWIIVDNTITIWSLKMVIEIKQSVGKFSKRQDFYRKVCLGSLGILVASDIIAWPEMITWGIQSYQAGSLTASQLRRIVSLSGSLLVFHISISFVYMHYIFKLIASRSAKKALEPNIELDKHSGRSKTSHDELQRKNTEEFQVPNTPTSHSNHSPDPEDKRATTTSKNLSTDVPVSPEGV